jgi:hypothetical protein
LNWWLFFSSINWILVEIDRCLRHSWARQNTYYRRHIKYYVFFSCVFFWNVAKAKTEQWGRYEINQMTETDLIREQVSVTMFTKLILQLQSDRISFTVLMIRFSSDCRCLPFSWYDSHQTVDVYRSHDTILIRLDGNRKPTNFETIFLFDFCVNIIRFFP